MCTVDGRLDRNESPDVTVLIAEKALLLFQITYIVKLLFLLFFIFFHPTGILPQNSFFKNSFDIF